MRRVIFLFLDGVGLGDDDPLRQSPGRRRLPTLAALLDEHKIVAATGRLSAAAAELVPRDRAWASPDAPKRDRAAILTGISTPARGRALWAPSGCEYAVLDEGSIFQQLHGRAQWLFRQRLPGSLLCGGEAGQTAAQRRALRRPSAVRPAHPRRSGGRKRALAADFTNQAWRDELGYVGAPVYTPREGSAPCGTWPSRTTSSSLNIG
ncbi:MAG: hypothetical protein R3A10_13995 [Caldilineaceae bacterium]